MKLKKFMKWPMSVDNFNGFKFLYMNTFMVAKPPKDDGSAQWRSVVDGSPRSEFMPDTAVLYVKHREVVEIMNRMSWAFKCDIKGSFKNVLRAMDEFHYCMIRFPLIQFL